MRRLIVFFLLLAALAPAAVHADPGFSVFLRASSDTVTVGTPFQVVLTVRTEGATEGPNLQGIPLPGIERLRTVQNFTNTQVSFANGVQSMESSITRTLIADAPGTYAIGPVGLRFTPPGATSTVQSQSDGLTVTVTPQAVQAVPSQAATAAGLSGWAGLPPWQRGLTAGLVGTLVAALATFLARKQVSRGASISLNAVKRAFRTRTATDPDTRSTSIPIPSPDDRLFFRGAREALTKHLTSRGLPATAMTTAELVSRLEDSDLPERTDAIAILRICDRARFSLSQEDAHGVHSMLTKMIQSNDPSV